MKPDLTLRTDREETWVIAVDGKTYTPEEIAGFVRFGLKYQFGLLEDILKERGLMIEGERLVKADDA